MDAACYRAPSGGAGLTKRKGPSRPPRSGLHNAPMPAPPANDTFLRACLRQPTDYTPVWLMRQAGRYLPEYRAVREQAGGFLQMLHQSELAAEVTLQPVRRFRVDAAILFSDILVPLQAMGMQLAFDESGPRFHQPLRSRSDIASLRRVDPAEAMPFVGEALRAVRSELPGGVALLGFAGAPFTLASYAIEGGTSRSFLELRSMMHRAGADYDLLADRLAETVGAHLRYQAECGAEKSLVASALARRHDVANHGL